LDEVAGKILILAKWIKEAKHVVMHTGAGISTPAGIPDFRYTNKRLWSNSLYAKYNSDHAYCFYKYSSHIFTQKPISSFTVIRVYIYFFLQGP
jgi:NAD-dependent SIR2 family protein deacetylase